MPSLQPVDGHLKPPWWRTVLVVLVGLFGSLTSLVFSPPGVSFGTPEEVPADALAVMLGMVVALLASVALIWRGQQPLAFVVGAVVLSLLLPLGNTLPWITLAALIGRRRGSAVWLMAGVVAASSVWVTILDAHHDPPGSLLRMFLAPGGTAPEAAPEVGIPIAVAVGLLGWALAVGLGLLVRGRREAAVAREATRQERATSARLGDEMARQQERERISREVHDVLGHRLSLLALHAGALESNAKDDERLQTSAGLVRESASGAMADLRSLLDVLQQPGGEHPDLPLTVLPQVVADSFGAGEALTSSIFIQEAERADPALSRAVYRIVQELLTNARKHAPGRRVWLTVNGGPAAGIVIEVQNELPFGSAASAAGGGRGRGLPGIAERAELLGGHVRYGLDEGGTRFRVRVEVPWLTR